MRVTDQTVVECEQGKDRRVGSTKKQKLGRVGKLQRPFKPGGRNVLLASQPPSFTLVKGFLELAQM